MNSITLKSPAKLNLYLRVVRKLPNGYHELETLFHRISLFDTLKIQKTEGPFHLTCSNPQLQSEDGNLVTKAYRLLQKRFPNLPGVRVNLTKRIPMGGGLGGGSSNAAFFLLGMRRLFRLRISTKELVRLSAGLGADIPFFINDVNQAIGRGIGDRLTPKISKRKFHFVLVLDPKPLSTPLVYQTLSKSLRPGSLTKIGDIVKIFAGKLDRSSARLCEADFTLRRSRALQSPYFSSSQDGSPPAGRQASYWKQADKRLLRNDLERSACRLRPSIRHIIFTFHRLGITTAGMSGSGPSVFAVFFSGKQARQAAQKMRPLVPGHDVVVCSTY